MNPLFKKQVYIRLLEHGTGLFYTVKYGRFATVTREMRLAAPAFAEPPDSLVPCHVPKSVTRTGELQTAGKRDLQHGKGGTALPFENRPARERR